MKFEIDDTKMDEATKKKLVDCVGLLGFTEIVEPVEDRRSGYVDMRVVKSEAGEVHYEISEDGIVSQCHWWEEDKIHNSWAIGNFYNTKEQAEYALERMKVRAELERLSLASWGDTPHNFVKIYHIRLTKHLLEYSSEGCYMNYLDTVVCYNSTYDYIGFKTFEDCRKAIETVGADRIKKYVFNVWD